MKKILAVAISMATMGLANSTEVQTLDKYRIETNDCLGCDAIRISSEAELRAHFENMKAIAENSSGDTAAHEGRADVSTTESSETQVVFLDFDAGGDPTFPVCNLDGSLFGIFNDYVLSEAERNIIETRIAADYAAFNFVFTQVQPTEGDFTTIRFGQNDSPADCSTRSNIRVTPSGGVSILFGRADGVDFLNTNRNDTAFADGSFWTFLNQLGGPDLLATFSGINLEDFDSTEAAVSHVTVNQLANVGAHEAGHILGLRHQNSFGAPGDGLPSTGTISPDDFVPVFDGPSNATESVLHIMASGASVGSSLPDVVSRDSFFSERSAVRLAINEDGLVRSESSITEGGSRRVNLRDIEVPNTIIEGKNALAELDVEALVVEGELEAPGVTDSYFFRGRAGEFFNAELISARIGGLSPAEGILGQLAIYLVSPDGTETLVANNARSFESPFDTEIFDAVLPETGLYRVEVSAPDVVFIDLNGDGVLDAPTLSGLGAPQFLAGRYVFQMFTCVKALDSDSDTRDTSTAINFLQDYNLVVFEDLSASVNIGGRVFVGGDLVGNSATFAGQLGGQDGRDVLVVSGDISGQAKNVNGGGDVRFGGELTAHLNLNGGGKALHDPTISTVAAENALRSLSTDLADLPTNSVISLPQNGQHGAARLTAYPNANGVAVFSIADGNDLLSNDKVQQIELVANGATSIVINLGSADIEFDRGNIVGILNNSELAQGIIWNFPDATKLTVERAISGVVLAPEAVLTNHSNLTGPVVVAEINAAGSIQFNSFNANGLQDILPE